MKASLLLSALAAGYAAADDVLYSKRLAKRALDDGGHYNISFFHVNDVHAHLDQYVKAGTDCTDSSQGCFGGYARIKTKVSELRARHPNHLWLNAGDEFQGTMFYSFYGGEKIAETMNNLEFDAMTLGNHEWDGGDEKLGVFLKNLTFPVVSCNVKSEYPDLKDTIKNYHIFKEYGLAIIGASTPTTPTISHVGPLTKFLDPAQEVQKAIWEIRNTTNIKRIVALTHIGYDVDQQLAAQTEGLSLIIGGHSHTLLGDMDGAEGKYPTVVEDLAGNEVFIVTSYRWGEYLGSIDVSFDEDGKALIYRGAPIHMDNTTKVEPELQAKITAWRGPFEDYANEVVGTTENTLDQTACRNGDCLLGEVMADAAFEYVYNLTADSREEQRPSFAFFNAKGVRATIDAGNITRGQVITSFPFSNAVVKLTYSGADLLKILEGAVSGVNQFNNEKLSSGIQVSHNLQVQYDPSKDPGNMLVDARISGQRIDPDKKYIIVTVDFVATGGDNIVPKRDDFVVLDTLDEVLVDYIKARTPLKNALEKRIGKIGTITGKVQKVFSA
ncbi:5'-nucleotidase [Trichoderma gamsii]|uniref:5'-nucleotidase n=1 Tax=Trichoderma gamsii TaxID=398673 RepID=A0A2P4ZLI2_9HYPO|nr:5'-nucleotidase [Trichoderma gamsii]PON25105.1 5'-nucleotidase [Trichoderma gamsii]